MPSEVSAGGPLAQQIIKFNVKITLPKLNVGDDAPMIVSSINFLKEFQLFSKF